jgi:hypothetical protein
LNVNNDKIMRAFGRFGDALPGGKSPICSAILCPSGHPFSVTINIEAITE